MPVAHSDASGKKTATLVDKWPHWYGSHGKLFLSNKYIVKGCGESKVHGMTEIKLAQYVL